MKKKSRNNLGPFEGCTHLLIRPASNPNYSVVDELRALTPKHLTPKSREILKDNFNNYRDEFLKLKPN